MTKTIALASHAARKEKRGHLENRSNSIFHELTERCGSVDAASPIEQAALRGFDGLIATLESNRELRNRDVYGALFAPVDDCLKAARKERRTATEAELGVIHSMLQAGASLLGVEPPAKDADCEDWIAAYHAEHNPPAPRILSGPLISGSPENVAYLKKELGFQNMNGYTSTGEATGAQFKTPDGEIIVAARPGEPLESRHQQNYSSSGPAPRFGEVLASLLTNRGTDGLGAALSPTSSSTSGFLLNTEVSRQVFDLARAQSVCVRAGAQTIDVRESEMRLVRVLTDPTANWRHEAVAITASESTFGAVMVRPRVLACLIPITVELMEEAVNLPSVLEGVVAGAFAAKIDLAALAGAGAAAEPRGVLNTPSINTVTSGAIVDYDDFSAGVGEILAANYSGEISDLAWILHPTLASCIDGLKDSTEQPLQPSPWVSQLRRYHTTALAPTAGAYSSIIGDFSQMIFGVKGDGIRFEILREGSAADATGTTWNATSQMLCWIRAFARVDVAIVRESHFTKVTGSTITIPT
jgi:HK97 family phage major capsid protein